MSTAGSTEVVPPSPTAPKSKKSKKKKSAAKSKGSSEQQKPNGTKGHADETPEAEDINHEPSKDAMTTQVDQHEATDVNGTTGSRDDSEAGDLDAPDGVEATMTAMNELRMVETSSDDTKTRLDALAQEREALRDEVASLRKSLEAFQGSAGQGSEDLRQQLEEAREGKAQAEANYQKLMGRVNQIKQTLGDRLRADAEELEQAKKDIADLQSEKTDLKEDNDNLKAHNLAREDEIAKLAQDSEDRSKELSSLRNRLNLSQQNWLKEREELTKREAYAKDEFESAKQAMQDWEILAMEERSVRENLTEKVAELEEQLASHRETYERLERERQDQGLTVDGLQKALQQLQEERKKELREMVENTQAQLSDLRKQLEAEQEITKEATAASKAAQKELERLQPFEAEVKEKSLLIGTLRHQAVGLNDHLRKALRKQQKDKQDDLINKELITSIFLRFLAIDRADPKKFEVLQLMSNMLEWNDAQREQAGLARPGASNVNLRTPLSPWSRTPSTPSLSAEYLNDSRGRQESIGGIFTEFLEKESEDGKRDSRSTSVSGSTKQ